METELDSPRTRAAGFVLAMVTIGSLVAIGYAATRPKSRSKRLVNKIDRKLDQLEERLRAALPKVA